ncbi:hypothetical protein F53441_9548 [Fusarium austroafricanum]|uniref:Restriction endonuclease domain-containing protein n=1 Tax=Fusarium austroafricanum TaxID=2364996 RepID=A0A8H4KD75_9HYPO|nr:hypothetical protein F53441_9548 [Fusarium austroafricanum]
MESKRETAEDEPERLHAGPQNDQSASQLAGSSTSISPEILKHHHLWETGHDVPERKDFHLEPSRFQRVHPQLERLFKRFEYDPTKAIITVIMPSGPHADTVSEIQHEMANILDRIRAANQNPQVTAIINKCHVSVERNQVFEIPSPDSNEPDVIWKIPDLQIRHCRATFPGLVIEVAYSQTADQLKKRALWLLSNAMGGIKVVIGIKLASEGISMYLHLKETVFHNKNEPVNSQDSICFNLADFALDAMSKDWPVVEMELPLRLLESIVQRVITQYNSDDDTISPAPCALLRMSPSSPVTGSSSNGDSTGDYYPGY